MKCPHCQNQMEIPDLWEFFDCVNCGASLQLENNDLKILKKPDEKTSSGEQTPHQNFEEPSPQEKTNPEEQNFSYQDPHPSPEENASPSDAENVSEDMAGAQEPPPDTSHSSEDFSEINQENASQALENFSENSDQQTASAEKEEALSSETSEKNENLSNILDFEQASNQKNHFTYHLQIQGLSSQALFEKVLHILKSPRLKIDQPKQSENSVLIVNNLNAVQMVYLLRKLAPLPVQIHWRQKSTLTT